MALANDDRDLGTGLYAFWSSEKVDNFCRVAGLLSLHKRVNINSSYIIRRQNR
jgi:hypothetical protein